MLEMGQGFFAMWCGIAPERAGEFALMHTRDHLGEHMAYLGEGGIEWARRYDGGCGTLPPFFVLYGLGSLDRLVDPDFAAAAVHETDWFKAIRPAYRDRIAHHCRVLGSAGAGTGGSVGTVLVTLSPEARTPSGMLDDMLDRATRREAVTAAHLGLVDWTVPIRVGQAPPERPPGDEGLGVLVLESFDRFGLAAALTAIVADGVRAGIVLEHRADAHYGLSYALDGRDLGRLRHFRRDDGLTAERRRP